MGWRRSVAAVSLACLVASPAAAANPGDFIHEPYAQGRASGYVGATVSILKSDSPAAGPALRLGLGTRYQAGSMAAASIGAASRSAVELDLTRRPKLYVGGRRLSAAEGGGGLSTGEVLLAIAGAAAAVFLITTLASSDDDDDDDQCLIEPELCD